MRYVLSTWVNDLIIATDWSSHSKLQLQLSVQKVSGSVPNPAILLYLVWELVTDQSITQIQMETRSPSPKRGPWSPLHCLGRRKVQHLLVLISLNIGLTFDIPQLLELFCDGFLTTNLFISAFLPLKSYYWILFSYSFTLSTKENITYWNFYEFDTRHLDSHKKNIMQQNLNILWNV